MLEEKEINAFKAGNERIVNCFYHCYYQQLYIFSIKRLKNSHDAEEIAYAALGYAWIDRAKIKNSDHLKNYLYRVARQRIYDYIIERDKIQKVPLYDMVDPATRNIDYMLQRLDAPCQYRALQLAIERLPTQQKKVIRLLLAENTISLIAKKMNTSKKTVFNQKYHAITVLNRELSKIV